MRSEWLGDCQLIIGDVREALRTLPEKSVQTVVTSPPYWGLRDYGVEGQIGLEATPDEYVATMVEVFRKVRRVLADDGTLWVNLGDSYASKPVGSFNGGGFRDRSAETGGRDMTGVSQSGLFDKVTASGLKPKDLVGIPWRVAFALRADGWYLRQDIIWSKPNPMPESVRDRCTKAHEYLFLLSKSQRYYFDQEAIKEKSARPDGPNSPESIASPYGQGYRRRADRFGGNKHNGSTTKHSDGSVFLGSPTRNKRSVWTVSTIPYSAAHFATYPPKLIEPCILAGSKPGDTVLDPFGGSGTTAGVALEHGRKAILIELSEEYAKLVPDRIRSITDALDQGRLFEGVDKA